MVNSNLELIRRNVQQLQAVPKQDSHSQPLPLNAGAQAKDFICETVYMTWKICHFNNLASRFLLKLWKWAFGGVVTTAQEQLLLGATGKLLFCGLTSFQWGTLFNLQGSCRKHKSYWGLADLVKATCGNFSSLSCFEIIAITKNIPGEKRGFSDFPTDTVMFIC